MPVVLQLCLGTPLLYTNLCYSSRNCRR